MNITINTNDGEISLIPAKDQSAGSNVLLHEATASMFTNIHTESRDAGGPSAALIQEVESGLGRLAKAAPTTADSGEINAGPAPV